MNFFKDFNEKIINNNNNFIAQDPNAYKVGEHFCKCPQADQLIKNLKLNIPSKFIRAVYDLADRLLIDTLNLPFKYLSRPLIYVRTASDINEVNAVYRYYGGSGEISVQRVTDVAFELLNVKHTIERSHTGSLGMDEYALENEKGEHQTTNAYPSLVRDCRQYWNLDTSQVGQNYPRTLELDLWVSEASCHTDKLRRWWIEHKQKYYCEIHPEDHRSCQITTNDLCNDYPSFSEQRACKGLEQAAAATKEFFKIQLCNACPEIYEKMGRPCPDVRNYTAALTRARAQIPIDEGSNEALYSREIRALMLMEENMLNSELHGSEIPHPGPEASQIPYFAIATIAFTALAIIGGYLLYRSRNRAKK